MNKIQIVILAAAAFAAGSIVSPWLQSAPSRAQTTAAPTVPLPIVDKPAGYLPLAVPVNCDKPVFMVVNYWRSDKGGMQEYGLELRNRQIYEKLKGWYIARRPVEIFEGTWDANRAFLIAQFPCREAARAFYYSKEYQEIIPYRAGATDKLTITVHEITPSPYQ